MKSIGDEFFVGSKSHPGSNYYIDAYEKTRGTSNDLTRMEMSQKRKDEIFRRVDNYARQNRQSIEEVRFAQRAEQIKFTVSL